MSDVPETPDVGAVEAPQGGAAPQDQTMPEGWTGEFNAQRAKATIDRLREFESDAQAYRKLQEDEEAFQEFVNQRGYDFADDEPEEQPQPAFGEDFGLEPDPLEEVRGELSQIQQWKQQQEVERTISAINDHIDDLAKDAKLELTEQDKQYIFGQAVSGKEINEKLTERAFKAHAEWLKDREAAWQKRYLDSKRAPAPPPTGKAGEEAPDPRDHKARQKRIATRIAALED